MSLIFLRKRACWVVDLLRPLEDNHRLRSEGVLGDLVDVERYQRLVNKLMYSHTHPDIARCQCEDALSLFIHMEAVYRILRYLKSSPKKGLLFPCLGLFTVEAYIDTDWAGSIDDWRSTSKYCTLLGGNQVIGRNKKQAVNS